MTKETISNIRFYKTSKEGQPLLDKNSRPYCRASIQTQEHGKTWMSGLAYEGSPIFGWKVGDAVEIEVIQNGQYFNFSLPKKTVAGAFTGEVVTKLFEALKRIEGKLDNLVPADEPPDQPEMTPDEIGEEKLPF